MKLRYTKSERLRKQTAEAVLADKAATPADRMAAIRSLERLETAARRRLPALPVPPPEPEPEQGPSVDDLVKELERRAIPAKPVEIAEIQFEGTPGPIPKAEPAKSPLIERTENDPNKTKNLQEAKNSPDLPDYDAIALQSLARAAWQAQTGSSVPPADGLSDWQRSQRIWREQAQDEADERARLEREIEYERRRNSF